MHMLTRANEEYGLDFLISTEVLGSEPLQVEAYCTVALLLSVAFDMSLRVGEGYTHAFQGAASVAASVQCCSPAFKHRASHSTIV